jgi:hypothetical protein
MGKNVTKTILHAFDTMFDTMFDTCQTHVKFSIFS